MNESSTNLKLLRAKNDILALGQLLELYSDFNQDLAAIALKCDEVSFQGQSLEGRNSFSSGSLFDANNKDREFLDSLGMPGDSFETPFSDLEVTNKILLIKKKLCHKTRKILMAKRRLKELLAYIDLSMNCIEDNADALTMLIKFHNSCANMRSISSEEEWHDFQGTAPELGNKIYRLMQLPINIDSAHERSDISEKERYLSSCKADHDSNSVFLMIHIPKTAGTYLNALASHCLSGTNVFTHIEACNNPVKNVTSEINNLNSLAYVSGHLRLGLFKRIASSLAPNKRPQICTLLRNPMHQLVSQFTWQHEIMARGYSFFMSHTQSVRQKIHSIVTSPANSVLDIELILVEHWQHLIGNQSYFLGMDRLPRVMDIEYINFFSWQCSHLLSTLIYSTDLCPEKIAEYMFGDQFTKLSNSPQITTIDRNVGSCALGEDIINNDELFRLLARSHAHDYVLYFNALKGCRKNEDFMAPLKWSSYSEFVDSVLMLCHEYPYPHPWNPRLKEIAIDNANDFNGFR